MSLAGASIKGRRLPVNNIRRQENLSQNGLDDILSTMELMILMVPRHLDSLILQFRVNQWIDFINFLNQSGPAFSVCL
jgi:hypothetical protein